MSSGEARGQESPLHHTEPTQNTSFAVLCEIGEVLSRLIGHFFFFKHAAPSAVESKLQFDLI